MIIILYDILLYCCYFDGEEALYGMMVITTIKQYNSITSHTLCLGIYDGHERHFVGGKEKKNTKMFFFGCLRYT